MVTFQPVDPAMARLARVVLPGWPHHVLQRGVRSLPIFHTPDDRQTYLALLAEATARTKGRVLSDVEVSR